MPIIRSSYSATGNIVIKDKKNVLSIENRYIVYQNDWLFMKDGNPLLCL